MQPTKEARVCRRAHAVRDVVQGQRLQAELAWASLDLAALESRAQRGASMVL